MSWQPLDAILIILLASFYAGIYALLGALWGQGGYRRLLVGWLVSLAGCIIGYFVGQIAGLHLLWLVTASLGAMILLVVASRLRI